MKKLFTIAVIFTLYILLSASGYSQTTQYSDFEPSVFEGLTAVEQVYSPSLEGNLLGDPTTQPVMIYLPPGYYDYPDNKYPVVYYLHGYTLDYDNLFNVNGANIYQKMNYMISQKLIVPMIVVTPNGNNRYDGCMYTNSYVSGNWEDYIVQDVIQHIEDKYRVLSQAESRGLGGFSMGGYGTMWISMRHPSIYGSIALICAGDLGLELSFEQEGMRNSCISAAEANEYLSSQPIIHRWCYAQAVAFSPDSTAVPILGRLPYDADGNRIDSIWQKWLMHDITSLLPSYSDSMLKLNAIQIYNASNDYEEYEENESIHQILLDKGIEHGYEVFLGGHTELPVIRKFISFFSEQLIGVVPTVRLTGDYYLERINTLVIESSVDGKLYIVPASTDPSIDSLFKYYLAAVEALANVGYEFQLTDLEYGKYRVFAVTSDSLISNIPGEFCVVPDTSLPVLETPDEAVMQGEPIHVSCEKDVTVCLLKCGLWCETLESPSEILENPSLVDTITILANDTVRFNTDSLSIGSYQIYGIDSYGIVSERKILQLKVSTVSVGDFGNSQHAIELFPNPVNGTLTIQTNNYGLYELSISSINGQLLYSSQMDGTSYQLDLSSFQKGVYFITISSQDFVTTKKIIKTE